jgi:hypothetical protein
MTNVDDGGSYERGAKTGKEEPLLKKEEAAKRQKLERTGKLCRSREGTRGGDARSLIVEGVDLLFSAWWEGRVGHTRKRIHMWQIACQWSQPTHDG